MDAPNCRATVTGPFNNGGLIALCTALFGFAVTVLLAAAGIAFSGLFYVEFISAMAGIFSALLLVRSTYLDKNQFLFSSGFWLCATVLFYFVLKAWDLWLQDESSKHIEIVLWMTASFLVSHCLAYAWTDHRLKTTPTVSVCRNDIAIPLDKLWILLTVYLAFKLFGIVLLTYAGGGDALELAAATQNAGAAYLYKIPLVGNVIFLGLLRNAIKTNLGWKYTTVALLVYLMEAVLATSRLSIVMLVLWAAFLYHRYRRPLSLSWLSLFGVPLVGLVVLFGYARNIEVGSLNAYLDSAQILFNEPQLITDLFMARLDMLPEIEMGLDLYLNGTLKSLDGASYFYAFAHSIPRNLWEAKPPLTAALVTAQTHPAAFADGVNIFPSIILEGLLNLSFPGVLASGLLVGYLSRHYERALNSERLLPTTWALSLFTFPMGLVNEGFHSNFTGNLLYTTALMALLYRFLLLIGALERSTLTNDVH